jgi:hypothetical protein
VAIFAGLVMILLLNLRLSDQALLQENQGSLYKSSSEKDGGKAELNVPYKNN